MIGLLFLTIGALLLVAYVWLVRTTFRHVKRRTGSALYASISVVVILLLTVGDTLFNRWYVSTVLCAREDVGVKIYETVKLPAEFWDEGNNQPRLPSSMKRDNPFLGRFFEVALDQRGGFWPLTAHSRMDFSIVDNRTGKALSRFVNYVPEGGTWWAFPLSLFGGTTLVGWFFRHGSSTSCFKHQSDGRVQARLGAFEKQP